MVVHFDHAVIAVNDLDEAIRRYQALGFVVSPGAHHPAMGTRNALIHFGLHYIELLSIYDEMLAEASGSSGHVLLNFLRKRNGGLLGYALATTDIRQEEARLRSVGFLGDRAFAMQCMCQDGHVLAWRLLVPGNIAWRRPWPCLIQWDAPDEQITPGGHENGVIGCAGIELMTRNLEQTIHFYQCALGLEVGSRDEVAPLAARRATFYLSAAEIDVLAPIGGSPVERMLDETGEGPFEITLAVQNLDQTCTYFAQKGIALAPHEADPARMLLPVHCTCGARLVLVESAAVS
jgi:catechol 2,3-dioxygenase-like lactoylglutathione lyase family enzyme